MYPILKLTNYCQITWAHAEPNFNNFHCYMFIQFISLIIFIFIGWATFCHSLCPFTEFARFWYNYIRVLLSTRQKIYSCNGKQAGSKTTNVGWLQCPRFWGIHVSWLFIIRQQYSSAVCFTVGSLVRQCFVENLVLANLNFLV